MLYCIIKEKGTKDKIIFTKLIQKKHRRNGALSGSKTIS